MLAVESVQERLGNAWLADAIDHAADGPFADAVVSELGLAAAGISSPGGFVDGGNQHVLAKLRADQEVEAGPRVDRALGTTGAPLPTGVLERLEAALGHDFSHVRVHVGADADRAAQEIQARAFAVGADLFFADGEFRPGTNAGDELLAHELTHVIQADEGRLAGKGGVSSPDDLEEREADRNASDVMDLLSAGGPESAPEEAADTGAAVAEAAAPAISRKARRPEPVRMQAPPPTPELPQVDPVAAAANGHAARDVVSAAVAKAPKAIQGAASALHQAEKKLHDDPHAVRDRIPGLLKGRLKPLVEPLQPHAAGEQIAADALGAVIGTVVNTLPEMVRGAGDEAQAEYDKTKKDDPKKDPTPVNPPAAQKPTADPAATPAPAPGSGKAPVSPQEPDKQGDKGEKPNEADATTQFFVQAIAAAVAELVPVPTPVKDAEPAPQNQEAPKPAPVFAALDTPKTDDKDAKKKAEDEKKADTSAKQAHKEELQNLIASLKRDEERKTQDREDLDTKVKAAEERINSTRKEIEERRVYVERQAAKAKKAKKKVHSPSKDARLRELERQAEELPKEVDKLRAEMERVEKELAEIAEKREKEEQALAALEAELAAAARAAAAHGAAGGGGGASIPPPVDEVKTAAAVLAAIQPKRKKLETDAADAKKNWEKLDKEIKELEGKLKTAEADLVTVTGELNSANAEVKRLEGAVQSRTAEVNNAPKPADGTAAPKASDDAQLKTLKGQLATAKKTQSDAKGRHKKLTDEIPKLKAELGTKKTALEAAAKKQHDADKAVEDFDKAVESLKDPLGSPMWQKIAGEYKVAVKPVPLPPGMVRDEKGELVKEADLKKKEEGPVKTDEEKKKEEDERKKKAAEEKAEEDKLSPAEKQKKQEERERKEKQELLAAINLAKDKPKAERDAEMERLAKEQKKTVKELEKLFDKKVTDTAANFKPGMKKEEAVKAGMSPADYDLMVAHTARKELQEKAAKTLGVKDGQEAVDTLWRNARERGLKGPGEMLAHLANVDPTTLPKDLQDAARRAHETERARINALPDGSPEREKAEKAQADAAKEAAKAEKRFGRNKELAVKLDCTPEEAAQYVKSLASITGTSDEDEAAEALLQKDLKKGEAPADLDKKLKEIHLLPPGPGRKAALMALAQQVGDPKLLLGATLKPEAGDGVVVKGQVANQQLKTQLEAIDKLPPDQQWDAMCNLARMTGTKPNDLARARQNLVKRDDVVKNVSAIEADETLTEKQKIERIQEIADVHKVDVAQIREFSRVERNKAANTVVAAVAKDPTLKKELDALALDSKKTPAEKEQALKEIARRTGIELQDLQNWNKVYDFRQKKARWKEQFKTQSDTEAADKMATLVDQYGSSDAAKEHLRNCPRDKLPPELRAFKDDLEAWDKAHPGAEVAPKLPRVDPNDEEYKKKKAALMDELDSSTYVDDEKALKLLKAMSKEERATLLREKPGVFKKFFEGVDGDTAEGKAAAELFGIARAYNGKLDKETADDTSKADRAAAFEAQVQTARDAAQDLKLPLKEARAHLQAVAEGNGMTMQQALTWLRTQPGKTPAQALQAAYATEPEKGAKDKVNPILRARLEAIDRMPARDRAEALKSLKTTSGLSDRLVDRALTETRRDTTISTEMHALRDLPKAERDAALRDLVEKYHLKDVGQLESIYKAGLARTATAMNANGLSDADLVPKGLSLAPEDMARHIKELARKSGLSEDKIRALVEARRSEAFSEDSSRMLGGENQADAFKKQAADVNMTPSQYADWLARAPASMLEPEQRALKEKLKAGGYEVARTDAEKKEIEQALGADPTNEGYRKKAARLTAQLQSGHEDDDILKLYGDMTPGEKKLFKEEYERETGHQLSERFENSLQGGDEDSGTRMLLQSENYDPKADAESMFAAVDPNDAGYKAFSEALGKELAKGSDADADTVSALLRSMPLNHRAQFLREYGEARKLAPQGVNMTDTKERQKYLPVDLKLLLKDDPEALGALNEGTRLAGTNTAVKDTDRTQRVQESIRVGREAAKELGVDQRTAFSMVDGLAKDAGLSPTNALRFLQGKPLLDESDKRSPLVKQLCKDVSDRVNATKPLLMLKSLEKPTGEKVNGQTLNQARVDNAAEFFTNGESKSDASIVAMLQGCNARERAEIDKKLRAQTPPTTLKELTRGVDGADRKELAPLMREMEDYKTTESHYQLIRTVKDEDPRKNADAATPEGFADRLQWAKDLPPEDRLRELQKLRDEAGGTRQFGAKEVMAAWLNGPQGKGDPTEPRMLTAQMSAQLDAINRLPSKEARDKALKDLAVLTGRWDEAGGLSATQKDFQRAQAHTEQGLSVGKRMQQIAEMPEDERNAAILDLSKQAKLSIDRLHELHDEALKSGQIVAAARPVTPDEARRIADIRALPAEEQGPAIKKLEAETGLTTKDINAHLQTDLEATRKKIDERNRAQRSADALKDKLTNADTDGVKKMLADASNDPAELKRILAAYDGDLDKDLLVIFGERKVAMMSTTAWLIAGESLGKSAAEHDIDYRLVVDMIQAGREFQAAPELPPGVSPLVSDEVRRIKAMKLPPDQEQQQLDALRARKGIGEEDFSVVLEHARVSQDQFDKTVERKMKLLDAEKRDGFFDYVNDSHVKEICQGTSPEVLAEIARRNPALIANIQEGISDNVLDDFKDNLKLGQELANIPADDRQKKIQEARIEHKATQLKEEFDAWSEDTERIKELLKDCSAEELKALDARFGGKLQDQIAKAYEPNWAARGAGFLGIALLGPIVGPIAMGLSGVTLMGVTEPDKDPEMMAIRMRLKEATADPNAPYVPDEEKIAKVKATLESEFDSWWTRDSTCLSALKSLSPRDLATLQERYNAEHGPGALEAALRDGVSGDHLVKSVALLRDAEDAAAGIDRGQQMHDTARQMAVKEVMEELRKDPKHRGKTDSELYELAEKDSARIDAKAKEKLKKISDSANSIFKAVDGWGDDETAVQKTLAGLSLEEIELVKIEYRRHFGRDLDTHLTEDIGGKDLEVMQKLMNKETRVEGLRKYVLTMSGIDAEGGEDYFSSYGGFGEDEEGIYAAFQAMSPEERTKVVSGPGGEAFLNRVKLNLGTNEAGVVDALTAIDPETGIADANPAHVAAAKMQLHMKGSGDWDVWSSWGTKEEELVKEFDSLTPAQVQEAARWYEEKYGEPLAAALADELGTDTREYAIADAEMRGDKVEADVHRLKWAAQDENSSTNWLLALTGPVGLGLAAGFSAAGIKLPEIFGSTDEELLEATLKAGKEGRGGRDPEHLEKLKARFNQMFADGPLGAEDGSGRTPIDRLIETETSGVEKAYFTQLVQKGEADPEIELLYSMDGWGTDEDRAKKVMERVYEMSPEERAAFKHRFASLAGQMYGGRQSLDAWIDGDFSGTEGFEMKLQLRGKPETPEDYLEIARMRWEFERGGGANGFMNSFMDGLEALGATSAGEVFANDTARLYAMFDEKGKLRPDVPMEKLQEVAAWQGQTAKNYRETRDSITDAVVNTLQVVGAVVIAVIPGCQSISALIIANLLLAAATTALKMAMKGNGYGWEDGLMDLAQAAVSVATAGIGGKLNAAAGIAKNAGEVTGKIGAFALKLASRFGGKEAAAKVIATMISESIGNGVQGLMNAALTSEDAFRKGDFAFFKHIVGGAIGGAVQGAATAGVGSALGKTRLGQAIEKVNEGTSTAGLTSRMAIRFTDGLITSTVQTATDFQQWEAWAAGKGIDPATLRGAFLQGFAQSVSKTAFEGSFRRNRIAGTQHEIATNTARLREIDTMLANNPPHEHKIALQAEQARLGKALEDSHQTLGALHEAEAKAQKQEQAREEVARKAAEPDTTPGADQHEDAARREAIKLALDATAPGDNTPAPRPHADDRVTEPTHPHADTDPTPHLRDDPANAAKDVEPAGPIDDLIRFGKRLVGKEDPLDAELRALKKRMKEPDFVMPEEAKPAEAPKRNGTDQLIAEMKAYGWMEKVAARAPTDEFLGNLASRNMVDEYGSYAKVHAELQTLGSDNAKDVLRTYRDRQVESIVKELQDSIPGLQVRVSPSPTEPHALVLSFEGARSDLARGLLEHVISERYGRSVEAALGLKVSDGPVVVTPGANVADPANARVRGALKDPIVRDADNVPITTAAGGELAYKTRYGFDGAVAADGAYEIKRKVVIKADGVVDLATAKADALAAVQDTFNAPGHRIVVAGVERQMRVVLDIEVLAPGAHPPADAHVMTIHAGAGRADSSNLFVGGRDASDSPAQIRATTAHELAHAVLGLGDTYKDDARTVKSLFGGNTPADYAAHENSVVRSLARGENGLHDIPGASLMDGARVHLDNIPHTTAAGDTWETLAVKHQRGILQFMAEAGVAVPPGGHKLNDLVRVLQGLNEHVGGDTSVKGKGAAIRGLRAGDEIRIPMEVPHPSGGLQAHQLKQIEWAIEQARRGAGGDYTMGGGGVPDRLAADAKVVALGRQRYLHESPELADLARAVADARAGHHLSEAESKALLADLKQKMAGGALGEHLLDPAHQALALHHTEFAADVAAQKALFDAAGAAVERMKLVGAAITHDMADVDVSSLRKRNTQDEFVSEVLKKQRSKDYATVGEMTDIIRGRFNVEGAEQMATVAARLQEHFGDNVVEVKPPRDGYPRWHINVRDPETGLVHEWQVGTKSTTDFFERKSLTIPGTVTAFKGAPDFHDGVYKLLNKVTDPEIRARYGLDDLMTPYKQLVEETGRVSVEHPYPTDYAQRYDAIAEQINTKLAAIEADAPGYLNHVLGEGPKPTFAPPPVDTGPTLHPAQPGTHDAGPRSATEAQRLREDALGPAWKARVDEAKRGLALTDPDSLEHDGHANRLIDLDRIARLHDPADAQKAFAALQANDRAAAERPLFRANEADLHAAQAALKANPNGELPSHQAVALLDGAIGAARVLNMAELGLDMEAAHAPVNQGGMCGPTQRRVAEALTAMGVTPDRLTFHHTTEGTQLAGAPEHYFTVARMPDGRFYLIDPTFGQFMSTGHDTIGQRLMADTDGDRIARSLVTHGYVVLDDATARAYGRAMTGRDGEFSAADFARPNGVTVRSERERVSEGQRTHAAGEYDRRLQERPSADIATRSQAALGMHHSEWAQNPDAQHALFHASAEAVSRMKAAGAEIVHGMEGAEVSSLRKRDNFESFVTEIVKKQQNEGYDTVGKMCDIVRGRFNVASGADVETVVARLKEKFGDNVVKVKEPREGYPRWHINVRDAETGLVHEWQVGTKATTAFFETRSLTIPDTITNFKGAPDFHDGVYKLLNKITDPEVRARHGIDTMLPEYKALAEATGKVSHDQPLPARYAERYAEMTQAINQKLAAIEAESPGYMNRVLGGGTPAPATTPHPAPATAVSSAATPIALAHAAGLTPPSDPVAVRGFLAERDKLGRMSYGSAFKYDVVDLGGVTEARIKVHLQGGSTLDAAERTRLKARFAGMTDDEVANWARAERRKDQKTGQKLAGEAGLEMARRRMQAGVEQYFNAPGFEVPGADGHPSRLRVAIEFVDEPHLAQHVVNVEHGGELGQAYSDRVQVFTTPFIHAHEAGHAIFGLLDEYADHSPNGGSLSRKPEGRRHKSDSRIANDQSLYAGDVRFSDPARPGRELSDPNSGLRERHIAQIREQIEQARAIAARGWTPADLDAHLNAPWQHDEAQSPRGAEPRDLGEVMSARLRLAQKMSPVELESATLNGWTFHQLQSGAVRAISGKMTAGEFATARNAGWKASQLARLDAVDLLDAGSGRTRTEIKAGKAPPSPSAPPSMEPTVPPPGDTPLAKQALAMHGTEFATNKAAQEALFEASGEAVERMKAVGAAIAKDLPGVEVKSLRKRDTLDEFAFEIAKKGSGSRYKAIGDMEDIIRGRFDVDSAADIPVVVNRLKEHFGDSAQAKEIQGYARWHVTVRDPETGLLHEWQVGTKATSRFYDEKVVPVPKTLTALGDHASFHDTVYKLLRFVKGEDKGRYGIKKLIEEHNILAVQTSKTTPLPADHAERHAKLIKAVGDTLARMEQDKPGFLDRIWNGEEIQGKAPKPPASATPVTSASTPGELAATLPIPKPVTTLPAAEKPVGVRGYMVERTKAGKLAYGTEFGYELIDHPGVSEARVKIHLQGEGISDPVERAKARAALATMTEDQLKFLANVERFETGKRGQPVEKLANEAGLELARRRMLQGVEAHYNAPGFEVVGKDGKKTKLRVNVEFVDDPTAAHKSIKVVHGLANSELGGANAGRVEVLTSPATHAHEIGHAVFGILDEYVDTHKKGDKAKDRPEGRRHKRDDNVTHDNSLWGEGHRKADRHNPGKELVDPTVGLRERHVQHISEQMQRARRVAERGWTPKLLDQLMRAPEQRQEIRSSNGAQDRDKASRKAMRLRVAEKMTPAELNAAIKNGWWVDQLQSPQVRAIAGKMNPTDFAAAKKAGWRPKQLAQADALTLFDASLGLGPAQVKADRAAFAAQRKRAAAPDPTPPAAPEPVHEVHQALAMHHSEFEQNPVAQKALFDASSAAVARMKAAGAEIVAGLDGAEVSSLRKRDTFESFVTEVVKKQKAEGYDHIGKMCDIVRGRFNVQSGADVEVVVARLKERFGDDVVKVKEPREGYPRWHINVRDAETGLVHEWQVGTKATTSFFETKSLSIPSTITAFKGAPDFHDGVYKLLNKITDPDVRARHGIDEMMPEYKALAEATGRVTHDQPLPERYAERYGEMTRAINDKLSAIERENPGYMDRVLRGEPTAPPAQELSQGHKTLAGLAGGEVAVMHEFEGRVLVQYKNGAMQWMEKAEAAKLRVAQVQPGVATSGPNDRTLPLAPPVKPGSRWAAQGQEVYANGSNTEFVHVDLQNDGALRRQLDRAHAATAAGSTLDQKLALLSAHIKDGITYDMAGQQAQYRARGGQVRLGEMIEAGTVVCREKALFTHAALAEMGIASKVVVGTVPDGNGSTGGHAWVELADGTIIDGTWGRIFPAGQDPVTPRTRRSAQVFAEPRTELPLAQAVAASRGAASILSTPQQLDALRQPRQMSAEDALVRPGVRAWHPDGRTPITVEYAERHKVQVRHDDGRVEILDRADLVKANPWALQQQQQPQQQQRRTHAGGPGDVVVAKNEFEGRVLVQYRNGAMRWMEPDEAAKLPIEAPSKDTAPTPRGSPRAKQAQEVYANGGNTEFVHVDLENDPALRRELDRAHGVIDQGASLDQKLALLASHINAGITYDMAAQQAQYAAKGGQVQLGEMIEAGSVVCREKALFTHAVLAEMGIVSKVVVGTVPDGNGATAGHAWVELADGTIIDGTWGTIFPKGEDPVHPRTRRNSNVFAEPRVALSESEAIAASRAAAVILGDPQQLDQLRQPRAMSEEEQLIRPGAKALHPDGKTPVTVEYAERHKIQVRHEDGRVEIVEREAFLAGNRKVAKAEPVEETKPHGADVFVDKVYDRVKLDTAERMYLYSHQAEITGYYLRRIHTVELAEETDDEWDREDADARVAVEDGAGQLRYIYARTVDVSSGPGPARRLRDQAVLRGRGPVPASVTPDEFARLQRQGRIVPPQIDPALYRELVDQQRIVDAGPAFAATRIEAGESVLVYGAGERAAEAVASAEERGARTGWLARMARPGEAFTGAENDELERHYDELRAALIAEDPVEAARARHAIEHFTFTKAGGAEADVGRKGITDLASVTRAANPEAGREMLRLESTDGIVAWCDRLVLAMGADGAAGPGALLASIPTLVPLIELDEDGQPVVVGLQTPDGAVRVLGAAARSPALRAKLDPTTRALVEQGVAEGPVSERLIDLASQAPRDQARLIETWSGEPARAK